MSGVRVPGSTSNLGAGFDCLGLALDLWLEARLVKRPRAPKYTGTLAKLKRSEDLITRILGDALPKGTHVAVHSDVPLARGLGSSAAAAVAGIALRELVAGRALKPDAIYREALSLEGHPDNAGAAVYGGLVLAAGRPTRLPFSNGLGVALAIPEAPVETKRARALLPGAMPRDAVVGQARRAAALIAGLTAGNADLVAFGMEDLIAVPQRKQLIAGFDEAVAAGRKAGALGVTISGSGSGLLAIAPRERAQPVAEAMSAALAAADNPARPLVPAVAEHGLELTDE